LRRESNIFKKAQRLFQSRGYQKVALRRQFPDEEFKDGGLMHPLIEITLEHRELVQIGEQNTRCKLSDHDTATLIS
jgi:hypothetical protein